LSGCEWVVLLVNTRSSVKSPFPVKIARSETREAGERTTYLQSLQAIV
jgi:hypothetical protein